jgi:drug/metabolite transporter (DMT)-like permease
MSATGAERHHAVGPAAPSRRALVGALVCAASAAAFGAMAIFGKLAYDAGVGVLTVLVVRFVLSAVVLGGVSALRRPRRPLPRGRMLLAALALGGIGYASQSGLYFSALTRIDAGLVALLLYTFPALVTIGAVALGRDRLDRVRVLSLLLAFGGCVLVLFVGGPTDVDALGVAMALGAALVYTCYILSAETVLAGAEPLTLGALVCLGGAVTLSLTAAISGDFSLSFDGIGWLWLAAIVLVSSVLGIVLFFAGLELVGPSRASIISTVEPLVTVVLAMIVFGEQLAPSQFVGGALVLASVVLLQTLGGNPEPPGP